MSLVSVEAARAAMLAAVRAPQSEQATLAAALGRVLAQPVRAARDQPPFRAASMDGYAARRVDLPGPLTLAGRSVAGAGYLAPLQPGEAVRIFTGAPVPAAADVVVPQEQAEAAGAAVRLAAGPESFIRAVGGDFRAGAALLEAGVRLDPWRIALLAASGADEIAVAPRPEVLVLTGGDELAGPGANPGPFQIFDSAGPAVAARADMLGARVRHGPRLPDRLDAAVEGLRTAAADVIVAIGGASVGESDLLRPAARSLGAELLVEGVAVRPGRPTWFARFPDGRLLLGLPGNPASALVCAELFLRPLLLAMQGADAALPLLSARLGADLPANGPREQWMRARVSFTAGLLEVFPDEEQDSGWTGVFARAHALVRRPAQAPAAAAGALTEALLLERL